MPSDKIFMNLEIYIIVARLLAIYDFQGVNTIKLLQAEFSMLKEINTTFKGLLMPNRQPTFELQYLYLENLTFH